MHDDHHHHSHDHGHGHHGNGHFGMGHNLANRRAVQWQTPHDPASASPPVAAPEPDFDLVEAAFISGLANAADPVSFLRLARIPFCGQTVAGETLQLLRVETNAALDVASLSPHLGGGSMRYDPLPAKMLSRRHQLAFVYFDGTTARHLTFSEALTLRT